MSSGETRIHIKLGHLEVDYTGEPAFLNGPLMELCKELLALQKQAPPIAPTPSNDKGTKIKPQGGAFDHSTDTIASLLGPSSGPNLALAAAAHLHFVKGEKRFGRQALIDEMKTAIGHYKATFLANLTATLKRLTADGKLLYGDNAYSLSKTEAQTLEAKLASN